MILAGSHVVIASANVPASRNFFEAVFAISPHYSNEQFCEFILPSRFRVAFFQPVGKAAEFFSLEGQRHHSSFGVTVKDVDACYKRWETLAAPGSRVSGPPKDHPWGERSFLLVDPDGNRWEVTQTPSTDGLLVDRE
ncbi:MAG: VOC family protein [Bdellovibrionales bacterium]|nr:VOC family protein [Bdellovibrionales bacterium]